MQLGRAALFFLAAGMSSTAASATALEVQGAPTSLGGCNLVGGEVLRWRPSDGPPAAFIAERFVAGHGNRLIVLGADTDGFWTAEIAVTSDACDDCEDLRLVHTSFAGERKVHAVADKMKPEGLG